MAGVLQVDTTALRRLSTDLVTVADDVEGLDAATVALERGASAMPGSSIADACSAAGPRIAGALGALAGRIRATAEEVTGATDAFVAAEAEFERTLGRMAAV